MPTRAMPAERSYQPPCPTGLAGTTSWAVFLRFACANRVRDSTACTRYPPRGMPAVQIAFFQLLAPPSAKCGFVKTSSSTAKLALGRGPGLLAPRWQLETKTRPSTRLGGWRADSWLPPAEGTWRPATDTGVTLPSNLLGSGNSLRP